MWIRVCRYKNAGVAGYAEAFIPVQSDSQTSEWYSYFENDVLVFIKEKTWKKIPLSLQNNRYTHKQLRRFGKGIGYSHPHETDYHRTELGGALGIRIQENHSSVLVSGTHHHFPAPTNYESIICCRIRHRIGSVTGRRSQKEINILSS